MTRRRKLVPPPPTVVPAQKPPSVVPAAKPPSTLASIRRANERPIPPSVLIIDDEESIAATWAEILRREGMELDIATTAKEAARKFRTRDWDVIVTDLRLPDGDGVDLLSEISQQRPATISIVITGYPGLDSAVAAIRAGVHDYLSKPCKVQDIIRSIRRGLAKREAIQSETLAKRAAREEVKRLARENLKLKAELSRLRSRA